MQDHCSADGRVVLVFAERAEAIELSLTMFFFLAGMDLAASKISRWMFTSFKMTCLPREVKPPE